MGQQQGGYAQQPQQQGYAQQQQPGYGGDQYAMGGVGGQNGNVNGGTADFWGEVRRREGGASASELTRSGHSSQTPSNR